MREWVRYALAVAGYIALSFLTKRFLTWTYGPSYFILTLEVLPRLWRRVVSWRRTVDEPAPAEPAGASR